MNTSTQVPNRLINEKSPYLLQHAHNPVDWYPWCDEAFTKAKTEDKPVFLSIGYSTCHWCHVMERECFENEKVAQVLNTHFISIKVDKEERPDVDSQYMQVCQSMTGSGGWPLTILMTPERKPFYAGTYLPPTSRRGMTGFTELLNAVWQEWSEDASDIKHAAENITCQIRSHTDTNNITASAADTETLMQKAVKQFQTSFDPENGGFGRAPKFPSPHNLLFLLRRYEENGDVDNLAMVEKTLTQMYKGGIFDHIGGGFSRYSTDERWLAPHFEKMLYDNALLILAYAHTYHITHTALYKKVALRIFNYVTNELTAPDGGFYCAEDSATDGEEGRYYVFTPQEIHECLGHADGDLFCRYFGITEQGNFEGKNIPNRLHHADTDDNDAITALLPKVYAFRKARVSLHRDDKVLTAWNGLMIAALAVAYRLLDAPDCLSAAVRAFRFVEKQTTDADYLYTVWRGGQRGEKGFLDDYAYMIYACLEMYRATSEHRYLVHARKWYKKTVESFFDREHGGFYLSGKDNEKLLFNLKETYDGAIPSGNAVMAYNMTLLTLLSDDADGMLYDTDEKHRAYMEREAAAYPAGHSFYWLAAFTQEHPPAHIVCVLAGGETQDTIKEKLPKDAFVAFLPEATIRYPLMNGQTTYYICEGRQCRPPVNQLPSFK